MIKLGLIGFPLGHSFSKKYYLDKFSKENIQGIDYDLYPIEDIKEFTPLYSNAAFRGFNVTIPHKQSILPYLTQLSEEAEAIGAVNCVTISHPDNQDIPILTGYNTDAYGFEESLRPLLKTEHKRALVLGNGGAAKAVLYVLRKLGIPYKIVSRTRENGDLIYDDLNAALLQKHHIIVNCSPIGTYPNVELCPAIPYKAIGTDHLLYDLIYNPEETLFLRKGKAAGAQIKNGYEMLLLQAEKNWEIWTKSL